jgi:hypothetical protein
MFLLLLFSLCEKLFINALCLYKNNLRQNKPYPLAQGWANFLWAGQMKKVKCQVGQLNLL